MVSECPRPGKSIRSLTAWEWRYCLSVDLVMASGTVWSWPPITSSSGPRSSFLVWTLSGECREKFAALLFADQLDLLNRQVRAVTARITELLAAHPDAGIFL